MQWFPRFRTLGTELGYTSTTIGMSRLSNQGRPRPLALTLAPIGLYWSKTAGPVLAPAPAQLQPWPFHKFAQLSPEPEFLGGSVGSTPLLNSLSVRLRPMLRRRILRDQIPRRVHQPHM